MIKMLQALSRYLTDSIRLFSLAIFSAVLIGAMCIGLNADLVYAQSTACVGQVEQTLRERALADNKPETASRYLSCFPYGDGANSVRAHQKKLEEVRACETAMAATTAEELRNFIMQWSQSECAARVAVRLSEINDLSIYTRYASSMFVGTQSRRGSIGDEKACALACKGDGDSCVGYSFETGQQACTLWNRIDSRTPRGGVTSGSTRPVNIGVPMAPLNTPPTHQAPPFTPSSAGSMRYLNDIDLPEGDYFNLRDVTLEQCNTLCSQRSECAAFTYNTRASACFLKATTGAPVPFAGAISGFKSTVSPQSAAPRPMQIHANVDLPNANSADDYALIRQTTLQTCKASCEGDQQCAAFTFNQNVQACILKRSYGRRVQFNGAISGTK